MKIVHFIPVLKAETDYSQNYLTQLISQLSTKADNHVVLLQSSLASPLHDTAIYTLNDKGMNKFTIYKQIREILHSVQPDIIHIHGIQSIMVYIFACEAQKKRIPIVVSTQKELMPWNSSFTTKTIWKLINLKLKSIHTISQQEDNKIMSCQERLLFYRHKGAVIPSVIIGNPHTEHTGMSRMALETLRLYQKTIYSNPFMSMTPADIHTESILLQAALAENCNGVSTPGTHIEEIKQISDKSWKHIVLHAKQEGIIEYLETAIKNTQFNLSTDVISNIETFSYKSTKDINSIYGEPLSSKRSLRKACTKYHATENETTIAVTIINVLHRIADKTISRRHIAELYRAIRTTNYDEYKLAAILKHVGAISGTSRLMQILGERLFLEEGYMPVMPVDDSGTAKMRRILFKNNIQ